MGEWGMRINSRRELIRISKKHKIIKTTYFFEEEGGGKWRIIKYKNTLTSVVTLKLVYGDAVVIKQRTFLDHQTLSMELFFQDLIHLINQKGAPDGPDAP